MTAENARLAENSYLYECVSCSKKTVTAKAATIEDASCCMVCVQDHNGPGKFEQYSSSDLDYFDAEAMGKALILYAWMLDSGEDEYMSNEGWGYCGQFGEYLLFQDTSGFISFEEFDSAEKASKRYETLYLDGWGADETDIYVSHDTYRGWQAYDGDSGKPIPCHSDYNDEISHTRILAAIALYMRDTGYYPDVWEVSDHGNIRHIGDKIRHLTERMK